LINDVSQLDQASAQWTLAQVFKSLQGDLSPAQRIRATELMKHNLDQSDDWIVQNTTMETLAGWALDDPQLKEWLLPRLQRLAVRHRGSVARRAKRLLDTL
jgi:hypothetical protein